jgi:hypothetical protein
MDCVAQNEAVVPEERWVNKNIERRDCRILKYAIPTFALNRLSKTTKNLNQDNLKRLWIGCLDYLALWTTQVEQDWKMVLNVEEIRIRKKAAFACFSVLSQHSSGETGESTYWGRINC